MPFHTDEDKGQEREAAKVADIHPNESEQIGLEL
jgi:hypothetical protein